MLCPCSNLYSLLQTLRGAEAGPTFGRTTDFERLEEEPSSSSGGGRGSLEGREPVSISQLANGWTKGGQATPTGERDTPSSRVSNSLAL